MFWGLCFRHGLRLKIWIVTRVIVAGPWTGFAPQAVVGRSDPRDHVNLDVVLPSFIEKVRRLAFPMERVLLEGFFVLNASLFFVAFSIGPLELQQKQKETDLEMGMGTTKGFAKAAVAVARADPFFS